MSLIPPGRSDAAEEPGDALERLIDCFWSLDVSRFATSVWPLGVTLRLLLCLRALPDAIALF